MHGSPVNSPHKGQWRGALMFSLICVRLNGWVNNREAGDLRCYRSHYDVIVMIKTILTTNLFSKYSWLQRWLQNSIFNFLDRWWYRLPHSLTTNTTHDDVIKWRHFPRCWPFVRGIQRSPVNSPDKDQWRGTLICALNKRLSKQWWRWWFETPSRSLWRHCNGYHVTM